MFDILMRIENGRIHVNPYELSQQLRNAFGPIFDEQDFESLPTSQETAETRMQRLAKTRKRLRERYYDPYINPNGTGIIYVSEQEEPTTELEPVLA